MHTGTVTHYGATFDVEDTRAESAKADGYSLRAFLYNWAADMLNQVTGDSSDEWTRVEIQADIPRGAARVTIQGSIEVVRAVIALVETEPRETGAYYAGWQQGTDYKSGLDAQGCVDSYYAENALRAAWRKYANSRKGINAVARELRTQGFSIGRLR